MSKRFIGRVFKIIKESFKTKNCEVCKRRIEFLEKYYKDDKGKFACFICHGKIWKDKLDKKYPPTEFDTEFERIMGIRKA